MRQLLDERQHKSRRFAFAMTTAIVLGAMAATTAWWESYPGEIVFVAGSACAILGVASFYLRNLFGQP
jgi:hypothetical protein